ncbi:MAG: transcriptional regulator [Verrucomicrobia bacterium Tous-C9LFEB]|nr:MAG: transcriptional regulator [Verrucomicrobia bacterium Tous-C9LFEB]
MAKSKKKNICGHNVRKKRIASGLSQQELAAKCQREGWDIGRDTIAKIESHARWVGDFELVLISKILKISLEELVSRNL